MHRNSPIGTDRLKGDKPDVKEASNRYKRFAKDVRDPMRRLTGKNLGDFTHPKTKLVAERAVRGVKLMWLERFRHYHGDECVLFPFRTGAHPRGLVVYNYKQMEAHRAMCLMAHKLPANPKAWALHKCGNGHLGCVNPNHLYWGDRSDNAKDAHRHLVEGKHRV